jgi:hypothetical protein
MQGVLCTAISLFVTKSPFQDQSYARPSSQLLLKYHRGFSSGRLPVLTLFAVTVTDMEYLQYHKPLLSPNISKYSGQCLQSVPMSFLSQQCRVSQNRSHLHFGFRGRGKLAKGTKFFSGELQSMDLFVPRKLQLEICL